VTDQSQDTAFWQKSFASGVQSTVPGYDLAALAIFAVPWGLGTVIGLSARAIETLPIFPTYPGVLTSAEIGAGFVMPYTIKALLGTGGEVGMLLLLFMAVTSTVSSSMIAVSSILSFDIYRTYINDKATDKQVVRVSHFGVVFHGVFITGFALMLNYGGADMNWVLYFSPIITCPGIFPLIFTLMWSRQSKLAAVLAPILGLVTGISIWLGTTHAIYGEITIATTQLQAPALYGSCGSLFSPILYSLIISYFTPETFDWREFLRIDLVEDKTLDGTGSTTFPNLSAVALESSDSEKGGSGPRRAATPASQIPLDEVRHPFDEATLRDLRRWYRFAWGFLAFVVGTTFLAWPMPLYRDYVFTQGFFTGWVSVAIFWQFFAFAAAVVYPVYDGRKEIAKSVAGMAGAARRAWGGWRGRR
jgi:hypothetical protein